MARENRQLTRAKLRAMGATPGLMAHKVGPDGRARLEQLTSEGSGRLSLFLRRGSNSCSPRRRKEPESLDDRTDIELDRLITKRYDPRDGDALLELSYAESIRRYNGKLQAALRETKGGGGLRWPRDAAA
jgi:hypothetical protein